MAWLVRINVARKLGTPLRRFSGCRANARGDVDKRRDMRILAQAEEATRRSMSRRRQRGSEFWPKEKMIEQFMKASSRPKTIVSRIEARYRPCQKPMSELQPIVISVMGLEMIHRRCRLLLRICSPPRRVAAIVAIAEDQQGTAVSLQLHFQPQETEQIMVPGSICVVKEPLFRYVAEGSYAIRVDHVSDIVWLEGTEQDIIPPHWRTAPMEASECLELGNEAAARGQWAKAERLYSSAIKTAQTPQQQQVAYLNRSLACLKLGRLEEALRDASTELTDWSLSDDSSLKQDFLVCQAHALYKMGQFWGCLDIWQKLTQLKPQNAKFKRQKQRVLTRLKEQEKGDYDFASFHVQDTTVAPNIDSATFIGAVEIRPSPGKGRGLFTTRSVTAGQLLLCEKPFAYDCVNEGKGTIMQYIDLTSPRTMREYDVSLLTKILPKLYHNPATAQSFWNLFGGDNAWRNEPVAGLDGCIAVDSFRAQEIMRRNMFSNMVSNGVANFRKLTLDSADTTENPLAGLRGSGIWAQASYINHSCIANCNVTIIGDVLILRAACNIPADTELAWSYIPTPHFESYESAQSRFAANWGFECDCQICQQKKETSSDALRQRKELCDATRKALSLKRGNPDFASALELMRMVEQTYPRSDPGARRLETSRLWLLMFNRKILQGELVDGVRFAVKTLEALGFVIEAWPFFQDGQKPRLKILSWGQPDHFVPWTFTNLSVVYHYICPELSSVAEEYAKIAYSIVVGEEMTAAQELARLKWTIPGYD